MRPPLNDVRLGVRSRRHAISSRKQHLTENFQRLQRQIENNPERTNVKEKFLKVSKKIFLRCLFNKVRVILKHEKNHEGLTNVRR